MKLALPRGQQWFAVIVIAILVLYLGNRLWTHRDITWNWKEEVQLADGSRMWVEREKIIEVRGAGEPFTSSRGVKTNQIIIPMEQGGVVWKFPLAPMILDRGEASETLGSGLAFCWRTAPAATGDAGHPVARFPA